jgi:hypothetical protein
MPKKLTEGLDLEAQTWDGYVTPADYDLLRIALEAALGVIDKHLQCKIISPNASAFEEIVAANKTLQNALDVFRKG